MTIKYGLTYVLVVPDDTDVVGSVTSTVIMTGSPRPDESKMTMGPEMNIKNSLIIKIWFCYLNITKDDYNRYQ